MKKLIAFIIGCMFALTTWGQAKFNVPAPTDVQKYQTAVWQWHASYILMVYYAKSMGIPIEEAGSTVGRMALLTWSEETSFDQFVNGIMSSYVVSAYKGKVEITSQSEESVELKVTGFYEPLESALSIYSITPAELSMFYKAYVSVMAEAFGIKYNVQDTEDGMIVAVSKN